MDPPEHTRIRKLVVRAFTRRRIEQHLRPRVEEITNSLLDTVEEHGPPADLVDELALPLTVTVICEILGVPADDRRQFRTWADAFLSTTAFTPRQIADAYKSFTGYLASLIAEQRAQTGSQLLADLIRARDEDGQLSETELVNLGVGLLVAGFETTANELANVTYVLLTHPDHMQQLREHPESLPTAVEELLRWVPLGASAGMPRVAIEDVLLGGVLIRAGETVFAARPAANRDEHAFPDGETLDLCRQPQSQHLAFGYGTHQCLGAHLARAELQIALGSLITRFPRLRLAIPQTELRWKTGLSVRGLRELPVSW
jgi:nocardicin N-oxygenase